MSRSHYNTQCESESESESESEVDLIEGRESYSKYCVL